METFKLEGTFNALDYNISHKVLLFRNFDDSEKGNIDLIFELVFYLQIPTRISDFILYEADEITKKTLQEEAFYGAPLQDPQTYFVIESGERKYYIGCWRFIIKKNRLLSLESSIK